MRNTIDRRRFVLGLGAVAATQSLPSAVYAAIGPNDKFDLLIKGGDVLDPSQKLRGVRDIGIRNGMIEVVQADIPAERALRVINAGGRLVTPGLIDLHAHTFPYGSGIGIPADELVPFQGTTTAVSAGDAGANNFAGYRRFIVASTRTRLYAFVHIATWASPVSRSANSSSSISRRSSPRRGRSLRTPTSRWESRCVCRKT